MKKRRIHFLNINKDRFMLVVMIMAVVCLGLGLLEAFKEGVNYYLIASSYFLMAFYFSKIFWYRNMVQYNKLGGTIKINSFFGKSFKFKSVKGIILEKNTLKITTTNNKNLNFDTTGILSEDIDKLVELLKNHKTTLK
ncbi:MAG: hypothetical protein KDC90_09155 [Ignavibacteriae bacterium]|nr:hypothetical protein [Ignavibacteriota bacterium]